MTETTPDGRRIKRRIADERAAVAIVADDLVAAARHYEKNRITAAD
jgi:hypothetical protein